MIPVLGFTMGAVCVKVNGPRQVEEQVSGDVVVVVVVVRAVVRCRSVREKRLPARILGA
jgi:hypothetical protein